MKIISGNLKGRKLSAPRGNAVRPTGARVKEALFSILGDEVVGAVVLDLFAGSGNLGIEALSRGAKWCTFVEQGPRTVSVLQKNLGDLGLSEKSATLKIDAIQSLRLLSKGEQPFDIIFLDPPYAYRKIWDVLYAVSEYPVLRSEGLVVWEHDTKKKPEERYGKLIRTLTKQYGDTSITFFVG